MDIFFAVSVCAPETAKGNLPIAMIGGTPVYYIHPDRIGELHFMASVMAQAFQEVRLIPYNGFSLTPDGDLIDAGLQKCWN